MGKMRKNIDFYLTLHTTYGGNENFRKLKHINRRWELNIHWVVE